MQLTTPEAAMIGSVRPTALDRPVDLRRAGFVDTGPPRAQENLIITQFRDVEDAIVVASRRTAGPEQAAAAVVELEPGSFVVQRVELRAAGALSGTPYDMERVFGTRSWSAPELTDAAVKALVDGAAVVRNPA